MFFEGNEDGTVGGSHKAMFDTLLSLPAEGFEPVACFNQENRFAVALRARGVETHVVEADRQQEEQWRARAPAASRLPIHAIAIARRARWLRKWRVDLLHLNNHPVVGAGDWIPGALLSGVPVVASAQGGYAPASAPIRWLARRLKRVLCDSDWVGTQLSYLNLALGISETVYLGVDIVARRASVRRSRAEVRQELGLGEDDLVACMVGNVRGWKGQHVLVEAIGRMPLEWRRRTKALIVGDVRGDDASYHGQILSRAEALGIADQVIFTGGRTDAADLVAASDVAVHASVTPEPFGLVVVEAMALGVPVVASNAGGPAEILTPKSGLLHDPSRPEELAAHLLSLSQDPALRAKLGQGALERVETFSLERHVATTTRIYREVLGVGR